MFPKLSHHQPEDDFRFAVGRNEVRFCQNIPLPDPINSTSSLNCGQEDSSLPLVSVIIPAYNAERFIAKTLESVLAQTYQNLEVLIVDDGSCDRTADIARQFTQRDKRVCLLQQPNGGVAAARNLGISRAKGEFIAPIDADDIWCSDNLKRQIQCFLESDLSVGIVYSWSVDIDEYSRPIGNFRVSKIQGNVFRTLICHNFIGNASATLIRRICFEKVGGYNTQFRAQDAQGCEDWDLYLRLAEHYDFRATSEFLVGYRKFSSSMSCDFHKMAKSHMLMLEAVQEKCPKIPSAFYRLSRSSFYMYLARQSSQHGIYTDSLYWLSEAVKADFITPLCRYGLYTLCCKNIWGLLTTRWNLRAYGNLGSRSTRNQMKLPTSNVFEVNVKPNFFHLQFSLLLGSILHRLLLIF